MKHLIIMMLFIAAFNLNAEETVTTEEIVTYEGVTEYSVSDFDADVESIDTFYGKSTIETAHKTHRKNKYSTEPATTNSKNLKGFLGWTH